MRKDGTTAMSCIENTQKIKTITMKPVAYVKCQIGQDWYRNNLEVIFTPGKCYPDYIAAQRWIMDNIDGAELNIEDVVDMVYDYFLHTYKPQKLTVKNYITGCKRHFDVVVEK